MTLVGVGPPPRLITSTPNEMLQNGMGLVFAGTLNGVLGVNTTWFGIVSTGWPVVKDTVFGGLVGSGQSVVIVESPRYLMEAPPSAQTMPSWPGAQSRLKRTRLKVAWVPPLIEPVVKAIVTVNWSPTWWKVVPAP